MDLTLKLLVTLVMFTLAVSGSASAEASTTLHCSGKSWPSQITSDEVPTDAIIRIDGNGTYISISAIGSGQSQSRPRMATDVEGVGGITLQSAIAGQPAIDAWFNINKFNGELVVAPSEKGQKILFMGSCKSANPLF